LTNPTPFFSRQTRHLGRPLSITVGEFLTGVIFVSGEILADGVLDIIFFEPNRFSSFRSHHELASEEKTWSALARFLNITKTSVQLSDKTWQA
jgi:hypothetical protein